MTTAMPERLREEDLAPGRPWVHPDTKLEYADFAAYLVHRDPLPHWRNARIKEVWRGEDDYLRVDALHAWKPLEVFRAQRANYYHGYFNRHGEPFAAVDNWRAAATAGNTIRTD